MKNFPKFPNFLFALENFLRITRERLTDYSENSSEILLSCIFLQGVSEVVFFCHEQNLFSLHPYWGNHRSKKYSWKIINLFFMGQEKFFRIGHEKVSGIGKKNNSPEMSTTNFPAQAKTMWMSCVNPGNFCMENFPVS